MKFRKRNTGFRKKTGAKHEKQQDKAISRLSRAIAGSSVHQNYSMNNNVSSSTLSYYVTSQIVQGNADNDRDGSKITLETFDMTLLMNFDNTPAPGAEIGDFTRVTIFIDKNSNGAYPATSELFAFEATALETISSTWNYNNVPSRFKILKDKVFTHDINGSSTKVMKFHHKFGKSNSLCTYLDNTGVATGAGANQLYIFVSNYDGGIGANQVEYQMNYDLKYVP